jgi:ATP diphosphatase
MSLPEPPLQRLRAIMARLRNPDGGCPWDLEQDFRSIAPYTIEEAYEVADAIERGDLGDLKDELGDLLLQVVFHSRMAEEQGVFDLDDVAGAICDKMLRRHPHVFGNGEAGDADEVLRNWDQIKQAERAASGDNDPSLLAGIPRGLPEWQRAQKLQKRAARIGFDWPDAATVLGKLDEELLELKAELGSGDRARIEDELGDVLFVLTNLARKLGVDSGQALRRANAKFERRFRWMEQEAVRRGQVLERADLDAQEALWDAARQLDHRQQLD